MGEGGWTLLTRLMMSSWLARCALHVLQPKILLLFRYVLYASPIFSSAAGLRRLGYLGRVLDARRWECLRRRGWVCSSDGGRKGDTERREVEREGEIHRDRRRDTDGSCSFVLLVLRAFPLPHDNSAGFAWWRAAAVSDYVLLRCCAFDPIDAGQVFRVRWANR